MQTFQYDLRSSAAKNIPSATWGGVGYFYVDPKRGV